MPIPRMVSHFLWPVAFVACWLLSAGTAAAQQQDRTLQDRIQRPDMNMTASGFEKTFTLTSGGIDKKASVRTFGFSRAANNKGDGTFRTRNFTSKEGFKTENFATKQSVLTERGAAQADRAYDTKTMSVQTDRAANKSAEMRNYQPSDKEFTSQGKRQEQIDELRRQKELSIEQVREILNKNK